MSAKKNNVAAAMLDLPTFANSSASDGQLDRAFFEQTSAKFLADPKNRLAQNVVSRLDVQEAAIDLEASNVNHHFSCSLREQWSVEGLATSQKASGRCWLFAMLNTLRYPIIRALGLPSNFELSQSHLFYWDKVERANFFLETMIETADEPFDSRLIQWLCSQPVSDGGQWDMAVNLIVKHGVMPQEVFPETFSSSSSSRMNYMLTNKLREFASELRSMHASGATLGEMRETKSGMMETINNIIMIHLGTPPATFDWSYTDSKNKFHKMTGMTPQSFYAEVCPVDVTSKVSLINDPRNEYYKLYTVDKLNNMAGGLSVRYINLPVETLEEMAMKTLQAGEPVWFGCDCGKFMQRDKGIFDTKLFDYDLIYNTAPGMDKETRLNYGESLMTHAMVFTAFDKDESDALPTKWRVENSWGRDAADGGYYVMTAAWFKEWMYQIAVDVSDLPGDVAAVLDQTPSVLPAWDPMGSLAGYLPGPSEPPSAATDAKL
jgi:bleomycin hydrolase